MSEETYEPNHLDRVINYLRAHQEEIPYFLNDMKEFMTAYVTSYVQSGQPYHSSVTLRAMEAFLNEVVVLREFDKVLMNEQDLSCLYENLLQ